jgi:hypothetical protein
MANQNQSESGLPLSNQSNRQTSDLLPRYYRTDANKKFLSATLDQLTKPGKVKKLTGYIGRAYAKSTVADDVFLQASTTERQNYQLEPAAVIQDYLGNVTFFKDYIDHMNHIEVFGGIVNNHARVNEQEFYSWDPHIDWDKFVNFEQYYWLPDGPPAVEVIGQTEEIESTFTVRTEDEGDTYAYIFTPDGLTRNPTLTLYKGQTYKFEINSPNNPFSIKTARVSGDLERYTDGVSASAIEEGVITFVVPRGSPDVLYYVSEEDANVGGTIQVADINENTFLDVDKDIIGKKTYKLKNGLSLSNGMKLYFTGKTNPSQYSTGYWYVEGVGKAIQLVNEKDLSIIGSYTEEVNQLFDDRPFDRDPFSTSTAYPANKDYIVINRASPDRNPWSRYNRWFHQDVIIQSAANNGSIADLDQTARANRPIIEFQAGLKLYNFGHKAKLDVDLIDNFTTDVFSTVEGSLGYNIDGIDLAQGMRVIFSADPDRFVKDKIFNVNFIEVIVPSRQFEFLAATGVDVTTDIITCNTPHGLNTGNQITYLNNGNASVQGLVHRKIYYAYIINDTQLKLYTDKLLTQQVDIFNIGTGVHSFEVFSGIRRQINLVEADDAVPLENETVIIKQGTTNQGSMYWYDGTDWKTGPAKTSVNNNPLFDLFDSNGNSFGDTSVYDGSSFSGNRIFSYKVGTGPNDSSLGFPLSYQNINNVGDIKFEFNLLNESFNYKEITQVLTKKTNVGYLKVIKDLTNFDYANGWVTSKVKNTQPVIRVFKESNLTNNFPIDVFDYKDKLSDLEVRVYINGVRQDKDTYSVIDSTVYKKVLLAKDVLLTDIVTLKCYTAQPANSVGYYEVPVSLQNNPGNKDLVNFTLGEVINHVDSIIDNLPAIQGEYPGYSNLRDLGFVTPYGVRFVQHSSPLNFALYHLGSKSENIFKAIDQSREDYNRFKKLFLNKAFDAAIYTEPRAFVDYILTEMLKDKPKTDSYYLSDMFAYSGAKVLSYTVLDATVKTYPLTAHFDLDTLSNKAVGIYLNGEQLLQGRDYTFGTENFFTITANLSEDDIIEVYEYESTDGSFCPPTPTKLGLFPLYEPEIFLDNTYLTPQTVIRGHDGSIVVGYNDYRDNLLLELEKRIFNNIKIKYNPDIFDIYDLIPAYEKTQTYTRAEYNQVLSQFYYQWINNASINNNISYEGDVDITFGYSYDQSYAINGENVPAYWRGIYLWMFGTDSPHTRPWECLGFSIKPLWWESVYGPAPYTSNNYILWDDIANGLIREPGKPVRTNLKFARSALTSGLPVDEDGKLISPLYSNFILGSYNPTTADNYVFGDVGPIETAWRRSSNYPFAIIQTALLLQPNKILGTCLDRSRIIKSKTNQLIYSDTGVRVRLEDLVLPSTASSNTRTFTSGLLNYVVDYLTSSLTSNLETYKSNLTNLTNKITSKLGGFTTKEKYRLLLDSKNPLSSGGVFVPEESYNLFLNTSSAIKRVSYSGIIVTLGTSGKYEVRGYDIDRPYFVTYSPIELGKYINIGGISESYLNWDTEKYYLSGKVTKYNGNYYRVKISHTSTDKFNTEYFVKLPSLPLMGGVDAYLPNKWNFSQPIVVPYGTTFSSRQDVVTFILGYGAYLKSQGFVFDDYNPEYKLIDNWETSTKEFLFWTTQNWAVNSAIALSPLSKKLIFTPTETSVVGNIRDDFYNYSIFRADGQKLNAEFTNTFREESTFTLSPKNTNHGIYGAVLYLLQKEHVLLLENRTLFNDVIYDQEPGFRQEKIKVLGYITSYWSGGLDSPGFIFDEAKITEWQPYQDYYLGETVQYKQFYYVANRFVNGSDSFQMTDSNRNVNWIKIDEKPKAKLLPNWDYKVEQFTDFYDLDTDNFDTEQQRLAQHLIGYQKRQYLENIINDDVSQYKFYQGMIIEKGTQNVLNKLFDVLSADGEESLEFYEEWAVRVGEYGGIEIYDEIEFKLDESLFKLNPQPFELTSTNSNINDFIIKQLPTDIYLKPLGYNNTPWSTDGVTEYLRTPGYVRYEDVKLNLDTLDEVLTKDVTAFKEGDYVWCAFEGRDWNVYRFTKTNFYVEDVEYNSGTLSIQCSSIPELVTDDIIGIVNSDTIQGFYKVSSVELNKIFIKTTIAKWQPPFADSSTILTFKFTKIRSLSIDDMNAVLPARLKHNELVWVDDNGSGLFTVYKNNPVYQPRSIKRFSLDTDNLNFGQKVAIAKNGNLAAVTSNTEVAIFGKDSTGLAWIQKQIITPDPTISSLTNLNFGKEICFSPDGNWMAISAPTASYVRSSWAGDYDGGHSYYAGDVVRLVSKYKNPVRNVYLSTHWKAKPTAVFRGSITGTTLTVTNILSGTIAIGQPISANNILPGTVITAGSGLSWTVSTNQVLTDAVFYSGLTGIDWSTINVFSQDWEMATMVDVDPIKPASTLLRQGYVELYNKNSQSGNYTLHSRFVSPFPTANELFGSKMVLSKSGDEYVLAISSLGYNNDQGRVYMFRYNSDFTSSASWHMDYDKNYVGTFDPTVKYSVGDIVFNSDTYELYQCLSEQDPAPFTQNPSAWQLVERSNILGYFPQEVVTGQINPYLVVKPTKDDLVESVFEGDQFGYSLSFSSDGSTLAISSPLADQYADNNFKGLYRETLAYSQNDIVYYNGIYYSYLLTFNGIPAGTFNLNNWTAVSNLRYLNSGKVFLYESTNAGYKLIDSLGVSDLDSEREIRFGESIDLSTDGSLLVVGSPAFDVNVIDSGAVFLFGRNNSSYNLVKEIYRNKQEENERVGTYVALMNDDETLVSFAANGDVYRYTTFDSYSEPFTGIDSTTAKYLLDPESTQTEQSTTFDNDTLKLVEVQVDTGRIDIFDKFGNSYVYGESLDTSDTNSTTDGYGTSIAVGNNNILVGVPYDSVNFVLNGRVDTFSKLPNTKSWSVLHEEVPRPNVYNIKKAYVYNKISNTLISYIDVVDPIQGKIPGPADQEIRYKTYFDPAVYAVGTEGLNVDEGMQWSASQVGLLWWDLTRAKFIDNQGGNTTYRSSTWNKLYETSSIDIYEWVESKLKPSERDALVGTPKGESLGITGLSRYGDSVYSVKKKYDTVAQKFKNTYYYWIKNPTVIPNVQGRILSAKTVASLIADPIAEGYACLILTGNNTFSLANFESLIESTNCNFNVEYWTIAPQYTQINSHSQWKILSENVETVIPVEIEKKWIHSLVGKDDDNRPVPDLAIPFKRRYGVEFRPRQSMFVNRIEALKQYIERVNSVISNILIADDYDLTDLLAYDPVPSAVTGKWDKEINTELELRFIGTALVQPAELTPTIVNGRITGVIINNSGYGYINAPYVKIVSNQGVDAVLRTEINNLGQVIGVSVINSGKGYLSDTTLVIRPYAVLVKSDSNVFDKWSIYHFNSATQIWERYQSQSYDVTLYWNYIDWYSAGYSQFTKIDFVVDNTYQLASLSANIGNVVKVNNIGTGGWILLEKYANNPSIDYTLSYSVIGRQHGTIEFSKQLYDFSNSIEGFDGSLYDSLYYDNVPDIELKIIIDTIRNKILVDELKVEYLKLFFASVRYALNEQTFVDWAFKTSFVKATHKVGYLKQKVNYNNDNLSNFEDYIKEVKPYRTQIREYISQYQSLDTAYSSVTDFDLPPKLNDDLSITPVSAVVDSGGIFSYDTEINQYPWKHWKDHVGFTIQDIVIVDGGSGYIDNPIVNIIGGYGTGATAKAYIANGKVNRIQIINPGTGYLKAPVISIDGSLGVGGIQARAVAIIESEVVRANKISIKFDRLAKTYIVSEIIETETFIGTGSRLQFALKFSPVLAINTHSVLVNGVDVLKEDYSLSTKKSTAKGFTSYSGLLTLTEAPAKNAVITIAYKKNFEHLSATDRINFYYNPDSGMYGKDLAQLMTGVDYGGVEVTGLGFAISGGWESLPWFSDTWDGFDVLFSDYIVSVSDSTYSYTLPYVPAVGEEINIYVNGQRIDDPYFNSYDGSTVKPNGRTIAPVGTVMQTIVGDGVTNTYVLPNLQATPPLDINEGDTIIFRKATSDGSYTPLPNEYDTQLTGGNLAYTTATGFAADDINVDGDGFVTPNTSYAPEEVVPGQLFDTVAIKVFQLPTSGAARLMFKNYVCDGVNTNFAFGQIPQSNTAVLVKLDNVILKESVDYTVDWPNLQIVMTVAPANKKVINIITFGSASPYLLDTNYFVSDGSTTEYITNAPWLETLGNIVLVDGAAVPYDLFKTDATYEKPSCAGIRLGSAPAEGSVITYMITSDGNSTASVVKSQSLLTDGSTKVFTLTNPPGVSLPNENNVLVKVGGTILAPGSNSEYFTLTDLNLEYNLTLYKSEPYSIDPVNTKVYLDGVELSIGTDFVFDISVPSVQLNVDLYKDGGTLIVTNFAGSAYTIANNQIVFANAPVDYTVTPVEIITFYNHNVEEVVRTRETVSTSGSLTVGTYDYFRFMHLSGGDLKLSGPVREDDQIWIVKNSYLLSHSIDFYLDETRQSIVLSTPLTSTDVLDVILFSGPQVSAGYGYMQFKDMLNRVHYKRINKNKTTRLAQDLAQFDKDIIVQDGTVLSEPGTMPGIIEINGERIEYFAKSGNTLSRLRRGTLGTGTPELHVANTYVIDLGPTETIPYNDTQHVDKLISDGSSTTFGLRYIPESVNEIEVFVQGYRLNKSAYSRFEESNDYPYSPEGDSTYPADFTVNGTSNSVTITNSVAVNSRVVVTKRTGRVWQDSQSNVQQQVIYKDIRVGPASFNVRRVGAGYTLTLNAGGYGYSVGDVLKITGDMVGGTSPDNDIFITITQVSEDSTNSILSYTYTGQAYNINYLAKNLLNSNNTIAQFVTAYETIYPQYMP